MVVTQPDRRRGRGGKLVGTPVKVAAQSLGLAVSHELGDLADANCDLGVVVAFGAMIPNELLDRVPMINVHFSLLPRWRGAAPVERAILAGDAVTGVCVMGLEATLDTGPVYARAQTAIDEKSADDLTDELAQLGARLVVETLASGQLPKGEPQTGEATYARKMGVDDYVLDAAQPVEQLARIVRLGKAVTWINGRRLRVLAATARAGRGTPGQVQVQGGEVALCGVDGELLVRVVQPEGGRTMDAVSWWLGSRLAPRSATWGRPVESSP